MAGATPGRTSWRNGEEPIWCPGCGDYAVLKALDEALARADFRREEVCWVSGIGCACRLPCFVHGYAFHGVHGRALPVATGIKLANPALRVIATAGDGDAFSIGAGHFPHACRRNPGLLYVVMDNAVFGMTKGQPSPTSARGVRAKTAPYGSVEEPVDPVALAVACGATFAGRAAATHAAEMTDLFAAALAHRGFAFVHVLSPCAAFNRGMSFQKLRESVRLLPASGAPADRGRAVAMAASRDPVHLGLFWREERPTLEEAVAAASAPDPAPLPDLLARYG